jgi:hypothetical protein
MNYSMRFLISANILVVLVGLISLLLYVGSSDAQDKNIRANPSFEHTSNISANSTGTRLPNKDESAASETLTFTTEQFLGLIGVIGGAVFWITYKIRGVEKDVEHMKEDLEKNPYLKAFRQLEEERALQLGEKLSETMNIWEKQKKDEAHGR